MSGGQRAVVVEAAGFLSLIQDRGRFGLLAAGVGVSGAADVASHDLANRLVANDPDAATIENTMGGLRLRFLGATLLATTGAPAQLSVDGRDIGHDSVTAVEPGQVVSLALPAAGLRTYLAIRGGLDVAPVMGSRSTDTLSGLGPGPLAAGDLLRLGPEPTGFPVLDQAPVAPVADGTVLLHASLGPREGWFANPEALFETTWTASVNSNRIGVRLEPGSGSEQLERRVEGELPVEGMMTGAIQVPPAGHPVAFLADHPVTGGYPVIATIDWADIPRLAQVRPGQAVRFVRSR